MSEWIVFGLAGAFGGFLRSLLGWSESGEGFDVLKFVKSLIRGAIGGFIFGLGTQDPIGAITGGFALDVVWHDGAKLLFKTEAKVK